jgi:SAM-dependent methyltransferase
MIAEESLQTKIEELDWDFADADTQYLTHSIHRYSGKFIPQIARQAVELLTQPGELVLDSYCGSGTTLLECSLTGRRSIGIDLNPLAVLIARVKTTPISRQKLLACVEGIRRDLRPLAGPTGGQSLLDLIPHDPFEQARQDWRWSDPWYVRWFQDGVRQELITIHKRIMEEPDESCRNVGLVAFSDILRKSSNAHSSYPNVMLDKKKGKVPPAILRFLDRLEQITTAVLGLEKALAGKPLPEVVPGNARAVPLEASSVDAVITHPPYIASIPYAEYGLLSITWLGHDAKQLDKDLTGGRRQSSKVVEQFRDGYDGMLREAYRVLRPGRILLLMVGNPVVKGERIDLAEMSKELATGAGFQLAAEHRRNGINRRANLMGHEDLLLFQKL